MNESLEAAAIIMAVIALLGIIDAGLAFAGNSTISNTSISYLFNVSNQTAPNMTGATKNLTAPAVVLPANLTANGIAASNALNITPLAAQAIPSLNSTANVTYIRMQGGFGRATVRPKLGKADISVGGTVVSGLRVRFRNQTMLRQFNISVTNESEISAIPPPQGQQVYQYIQINQSIYNSSLSIDPYISNVTYNFQVSAAWLSQQGVQAQNITLMKYDNSTMNWTALPTVLVGYNSSYYAYSSVSNSFSTYAIAYSYSNAIGSGAVKASLINNYNLYFYAGSTNSSKGNSQTTVSWTRTSAAQYTSGSGSSKLFRNATVGYSTSNSGTFTGTALSNNIVVELGFNAIEANGAVFSANTGTTATGTSNVLTFKTVTANSFVVIVSAVSNHTLAASGFKTTAPGNVIVESVNGKAEWAGIMVINSLAVGTYTVTTTASAKGAIAQSAFVFPTYSVTFNDFPTTANIATNGINQVNGNTISGLIGMGTINAIAPSGVNSVFSNWAFGGNLIVTDPTAQNTFLVVEGNDVLTANFNSLTTFTETGLPAGTTWNVVYNGLTVYNSPPPSDTSVTFNEPWWGTFSYTVADQGAYLATPSSGTLASGGTLAVTFAVSACYISVSNALIDFGEIDPGSNVPTANVVTVTDNLGNSAANILIAGGIGSTSPFNGIWLGTSDANQIGISNTLWDDTLDATYAGTSVTNSPVDTGIMIPNPGGGSAANTVYLGMGIPGGSPSDTYTANIIVEETC